MRFTRVLVYFVLSLTSACAARNAYQLLDVASAYEEAGEQDAALEAFQGAVDIRPDDPYIRRRLGRAYLRREMYEAAARELETVLSLEPHYLEAYQDLAYALSAQGMPEASMGWLERAVREVGDYLPIQRQLVDLYLTNDRSEEAMSLLKDAVHRWPEATWAHFLLGTLYEQLDLYEKAEASFRTVVKIEPDLGVAYASLGNLLYEQHRTSDAIQAYVEAISINPRDHASLNNLAWVYAVEGIKLDFAERLSRRSLRLVPDSAIYLDTLAEIYFRAGERELATEFIRRAISLRPDDPELMEHLRRQLQRFTAPNHGKV